MSTGEKVDSAVFAALEFNFNVPFVLGKVGDFASLPAPLQKHAHRVTDVKVGSTRIITTQRKIGDFRRTSDDSDDAPGIGTRWATQ